MSATTSDSVPEDLKTLFDPKTCTRKGLCPVTEIRKQGEDPLESHSLYFEVHGSGPERIVFIMGLNSTSFAWAPQVEHFGRLPEYSVLVFDNRGVGNSGVPKGPYSTSQMAQDAIVLLDYIGWKEERSIHVVGISLGGMISQELATRVPERIVSLTLAVTTPGGWRPFANLPTWKGVSGLTRATFITDPAKKIPIVLEMVYPVGWLDQVAEDDPLGRTNRELQTEAYADRMLVTRPQSFIGAFSQMLAGMTHQVLPDRLQFISKSIPKVLIVTGDQDNLVDTRHSEKLKECMPEAEFVRFEGTGHGIHAQQRKKFNALLERVFKEGREKVRGGQ
ncbi:alpha/beta-hydrolase [Heliocybe sulcata]|uniref:Alpha/beta-hydrolase n=1 Tax=Heliocybe sulcata TaxID=5364 RepID=A0A5C3N8Q0_9AGAM|nr:alpha/beta-hydrolase [Heliocybe sulcata]